MNQNFVCQLYYSSLAIAQTDFYYLVLSSKSLSLRFLGLPNKQSLFLRGPDLV